MKKLIMSFVVVTLLAGCGGSGGKETLTCKMDDSFEVKFDAKDDKVTDAVIKWRMNPLSGNPEGIDGSKMTADEKAAMDKNTKEILGIKEGDGVDTKIEYNGDHIFLTLTFAFPKSSPAILKRLTFDGGPDMNLSKMVEAAKKGGGTCE